MAVQHMVWLKFKPGVTPQRIAHHMTALAAMKGQIDHIGSITVGPNFTDRADGYTHGLVVTVADRAALQAYLEHPDHLAVAAPLREDAEILAMDIEE